MKYVLFLSIFMSAIYAQGIPSIKAPSAAPGDALLKTVHAFPNETWVENIAVRSNGKVLVTLITSPEVWQVDPFAPPEASAELIHSFPDALSALGIAEIEEDVFAVNIGNWSAKTFAPTKGSWSVWSLNLRGREDSACGVKGPGEQGEKKRVSVHKIADLPEATFLNGMAVLPSNPRKILTADSGNGVIYRVDASTGAHDDAISSPALHPNASLPIQLGVNGIRFRPQDPEPQPLYFTNSFRTPVLGRIPVHAGTGLQSGAAESILAYPTYPENENGQADDFAFDRTGNVWLTTDTTSTLVQVSVPEGETTIIAGRYNSSALPGPTSCAFGRTEKDKDVLYIVTTGGIAYPPPGGIVPGKVVALDVLRWI